MGRLEESVTYTETMSTYLEKEMNILNTYNIKVYTGIELLDTLYSREEDIPSTLTSVPDLVQTPVSLSQDFTAETMKAWLQGKTINPFDKEKGVFHPHESYILIPTINKELPHHIEVRLQRKSDSRKS